MAPLEGVIVPCWFVETTHLEELLHIAIVADAARKSGPGVKIEYMVNTKAIQP